MERDLQQQLSTYSYDTSGSEGGYAGEVNGAEVDHGRRVVMGGHCFWSLESEMSVDFDR